MLRQLSHPCIMSLYGVSRGADGSLFMVLEYCDAGDLSAYYTTEAFGRAEFLRVLQVPYMYPAFEFLVAHTDAPARAPAYRASPPPPPSFPRPPPPPLPPFLAPLARPLLTRTRPRPGLLGGGRGS